MEQTVVLLVLSLLGAVGLYLAMPGGRANLMRLGLLLLAATGVTAVGLTLSSIAGGMTRGWFFVLAAVGLLGAVRMITHKRPIYSALYFILVIVSVMGLLVLMQAEFLAAALVIIYAGAILVTYVFVIMLAQQNVRAPYDAQSRDPLLGCVAGFVLLAVIAAALFTGSEAVDAVSANGASEQATELFSMFTGSQASAALPGSTLNVGTRLLTKYVVAIQIAGVLLLAALVGAIAIARRKVDASIGGEVD